MTFAALRALLAETDPFRQVLRAIEGGQQQIAVHGLAGSLSAFALGHLRGRCDRQMLAVVPTTDAAEELRDDLEAILGEQHVRYFPDWELIPFEAKSPHVEVTALRLESLQALLIGQPVVVVAPVAALLKPTLEPEALAAASRVVRVGDVVDLDELARWLRALSFEAANQVQEMGQYARRGGIIDIFTFGAERPFRVELFDDEVESIRAFDPATQRSVETVEEVEVLPRREVLTGDQWWGDAAGRLGAAEAAYDVDLHEIRERVQLGIHFDGIEYWAPILSGVKPSLLDHLDARAIVWLAEPEDIAHHARRFSDEAAKIIARRRERGEPAVPIDAVLHDWDDLAGRLAPRTIVAHHSLRPQGEVVEFGARGVRQYEGSLDALREDMAAMARDGGRTLLLAENQSQAQRLEELLETALDLTDIDIRKLTRGFVYPAARIQIVNDHELFSRYRGRHRYRKFRGAAPVSDVFSLTPGDIVVHEDHGIGIYQGLERITIDSISRDTVRVLYRDQDKLFVPADQIDRIQRYTREEGVTPVLSKLGGTDWERVRERTKRGVAKLARDLVELYARRQSQPGFAFGKDTSWMQEMEAAFIYEETPDQLRAIEEIKRNMEEPVPMDRLVCGDVGYGKTEVAIRAAFKAVSDHKQVAVLVPTTILAQQHFRTFSERLADFPLRIDMLSRFRSKDQIEETLHDLERGKVDIAIGTHRLLSKDMKFADLGLLIIDEEHRFGVRHKELLKQMRTSVDVISMTATPIPRTLYLSLMGARDMSVINTPPKDRLPVHTEIIPFDEDRVGEAILREIERSGQVFFVHNRVQTIDEHAEWLKELLPEVRLQVAHGQMGEHQLERVMLDFLERRFDVLVTTMIIQSGLDMPNVNTIIVDRADQFGLAELYQLRGRVGRSAHRAYAYLMIPQEGKINPNARRRLRAIEEYSDLGSGFKIAMRDLEIRGAGNLLGTEQHGFIAAVGFDLYVKLLDEAVRELKGERVEARSDCDVDVHISAYLPDDYVADGEQKMALYRRLSEARTIDEVDEFAQELRDRYGRTPEPAEALLALMKIKLHGRALGARRISVDRQGRLTVCFSGEGAPGQEALRAMVRQSLFPIEFRWEGELFMKMQLDEPAGLAQTYRAVEALGALQEGTLVQAA